MQSGCLAQRIVGLQRTDVPAVRPALWNSATQERSVSTAGAVELIAVDPHRWTLRVVQRAAAAGHRDAKRRHVLGRHLHGVRVDDLGIDPGPLPVFFQAFESDPKTLGIAQRERRETDAPRNRVAAAGHDRIDPPVDLFFGLRVIRMRGVGTDDVSQLHALRLQCGGHDVGRLLLPVLFAAIGHGRTIEQVYGIVGAIVDVPQLLLVPRWGDLFVLKYPQEFTRLGKTGSRRGGREQARIVHGELPASRSAHRKATDHDAIVVDRVATFDVGQRFEQIDLAGQFVGVAVAAVEMHHESVGGRELAQG